MAKQLTQEQIDYLPPAHQRYRMDHSARALGIGCWIVVGFLAVSVGGLVLIVYLFR